MTTAEVVDTLASPLNAFKIINTGDTIGAFTEDRDSAIRGVLGVKPHMIPVHITVAWRGPRPQAEHRSRRSAFAHPAGHSRLALRRPAREQPEQPPKPAITSPAASISKAIRRRRSTSGPPPAIRPAAQLSAAMQADQSFARLYANGARQGADQSHRPRRGFDSPPRAGRTRNRPHRLRQHRSRRRHRSRRSHRAPLAAARAQHPHPHQAACRASAPVTVRLLVSDAGTLDRALNQPRISTRTVDLDAALAQAQASTPPTASTSASCSPTPRPESTAKLSPRCRSPWPTPWSLCAPPRMSPSTASPPWLQAEAPAGGVLTGFQILNLHIEPGGGLD